MPLCVVLELPVTSPLANAVLKTLENWEQIILEKMNKFDGPPPNYINTYPTDLSAGGGPAILRHKAMLEPDNTPFKWVFALDVSIKPKTYWIFKELCIYVYNCTSVFCFFFSLQVKAPLLLPCSPSVAFSGQAGGAPGDFDSIHLHKEKEAEWGNYRIQGWDQTLTE